MLENARKLNKNTKKTSKIGNGEINMLGGIFLLYYNATVPPWY